MHSIILVSLVFLTGCAVFDTKRTSTHQEKTQKNTKSCVKELLKEGIHESLVYPICKDIYGRRPIIIKQDSNGLKSI